MKKNKKLLIGIGIVALLSIILIEIFNGQQEGGKVDRIGALFPLTGNVASIGQYLKNGLELGCESVSNGVEVIIEDSKADAKTGYAAFQRMLLAKKPRMIFTAISGVALAIRDVAEKEEILHFSMVGSENLLTAGTQYTYRFFPSSDYICCRISQWLSENKVKRIAVLYLNNDWGESYKESMLRALENSNIQIAYQSSVDLNRDSYSNIAHMIKNACVECVCISMQGDVYADMIKRIRSIGYTGVIMCDNNFTAAVAERCRNDLQGLKVIDFQKASGSQFAKFSTDYKERYGNLPDMPAILSYEVMRIICTVIEKKGRDAWYHASQLQGFEYDGMIGRSIITGREIRFPLEVKDATDLIGSEE